MMTITSGSTWLAAWCALLSVCKKISVAIKPFLA
jgi:hypothetical protein